MIYVAFMIACVLFGLLFVMLGISSLSTRNWSLAIVAFAAIGVVIGAVVLLSPGYAGGQPIRGVCIDRHAIVGSGRPAR